MICSLKDDRMTDIIFNLSYEISLLFWFICFNFRITISEDGSLKIVNVTKSDAGSYTCIATNHFGTASSTGNLVVKGNDNPENTYIDIHVLISNTAIYRRGIIHINMYSYHCVAKLIHHAKHYTINDS